MSQRIQLRRGTAAELATIIPAQGEPCWSTDSKELFIGDGVTVGGIPVDVDQAARDAATAAQITADAAETPAGAQAKADAAQAAAIQRANHTGTQAWSTITATPTTRAGYGITDAQPLDADLTALAGLSTTGLIARTGEGTAALRTIMGTANQVVVANGGGSVGNPTLSLPQSIAVSSSPQFAGLGIGGAAAAGFASYIRGSATGAASAYGYANFATVQPDVTAYTGFASYIGASAGTYTLADIIHYVASQASIGAGAVVTQQTGFLVSSGLTGATSNYGFRSTLPAATGRWNLYFPGTAQNYIAGNVGIGVSVPTSQLHTTGTVRFGGFGAGTLITDSSGNVTASSDRRLKDISGKFTRGLAAIMEIQPKVFTWRPESGMNTLDVNVGFIAQDVLPAIPEAVGTMKTNDVEEDDVENPGKKVKKSKREAAEFLTLSDRPILAAVVNAIKELKAENDSLRSRIAAIEGS